MTKPTEAISNKSATIALLLCIFLGSLGIHRFYVGKYKTGILMLLTLGGLGIWMLVDLILIARCDFTDSNGNYLMFMRDITSPLKLILIIVGSVMLAFICYVFLLFSLVMHLTSPMTDVIQKQLSALRQGDMTTAYSYMAGETKDSVSLNDFKKFMERYPIMTTNIDASFPVRKFENGNGSVISTLKTNDGTESTVEYRLTKEDHAWKIVAIHVGRTQAIDDTTSAATKTYQDKLDHYIIQYPGDWSAEQTTQHAVMLSGKEGTPSSSSAITIQAMPDKSAGGVYTDSKAAIDDLKKRIAAQATNAKFLDTGTIELPKEAKKIHGEYFIATYTYEGHAMKKMQFILSREGEATIYSWSYTTTVDQYEKDLPVAKSIYESWKIE